MLLVNDVNECDFEQKIVYLDSKSLSDKVDKWFAR